MDSVSERGIPREADMSRKNLVWAATSRLVRAIRWKGTGVFLLCLLTGWSCVPSGDESIQETPYDDSGVPQLPAHSLLSELNAVERSLLWRANEARRKAGAPPLTLKADLCVVARKHNNEMIRLGYLTRMGPGGADVGKQLHDQGVVWNLCAINLAEVSSSLKNQGEIAQKAVDLWLSQPTARRDLLFNLYNETGVAVQRHPRTGQWFLTQIYARRTSYWLPP